MDAKRRRRVAQMSAGIERAPAEIRAAKRVFTRLDCATQFRICREIAETRGGELFLAYRNLLSVGFGYKTRKRSGKAEEQVDFRWPCVIFVVSRKWLSKGRPKDPQRLPAHLFTYVASGNQRMLCAVPTDVKRVASYGAQARPHQDELALRPYGIAVKHAGGSDMALGVVACALEREEKPGTVFALSCRHVFSMSLSGAGQPSGSVVLSIGDNAIIGKTVAVRGRLVSEPAGSFDAQLAETSDMVALQSALSGLLFDSASPSARGPEEMPRHFWVLTSREDAQGERLKVWMETRDYVSKILSYEGMDAAHHHILHAIATDGELMPGDSGAPAVPVMAGRKFLGMYIGGDGTNAYIIPAWQLMRGANYGVSSVKLWTVVNP